VAVQLLAKAYTAEAAGAATALAEVHSSFRLLSSDSGSAEHGRVVDMVWRGPVYKMGGKRERKWQPRYLVQDNTGLSW
jgi:hypothetical protein